MIATPLALDGAWEFVADVHRDDRGSFFEAFSVPSLIEETGLRFDVAQVNVSTSAHGTIRGIHYADVPPGQAKFVQCIEGEILDVLVDLRVGSPTFGKWVAVRLTSDSRNAVLIPIGFGHAFQTLSDHATVMYCCNAPYAPAHEHGINPMDADLALPWDAIEPLLSPKDAAAPSWVDTLGSGTLPLLAACHAVEAEMRA